MTLLVHTSNHSPFLIAQSINHEEIMISKKWTVISGTIEGRINQRKVVEELLNEALRQMH